MTDTQAPWPEVDDHLLPRGTVIKEQYEITGYLGGGGYGHVYLAHHRLMARQVAIKVLNATQDRLARERFLREAQASAMIDHPNAITVYDFGFLDGEQPFIIMELLKGHDLEEELRLAGPLKEKRALTLLLPALEALQEAHKHGIVHKDLKPSNLFLAYPGEQREHLKVIDFGVACTTEPPSKPDTTELNKIPEGATKPKPESGRLTVVGQSIGTPHYMAPEYLEKQTATPAVDVYQMGLIIVELLTGKVVVQADSHLSAMVKHIKGELDIPQAYKTGPLGAIIKKATARLPEDRYSNASGLRDALFSYYETRFNPPREIISMLPTRGDLAIELGVFVVMLAVVFMSIAGVMDSRVQANIWAPILVVVCLFLCAGATWSSLRFFGGRVSSMPWFWTRGITGAGMGALTLACLSLVAGSCWGSLQNQTDTAIEDMSLAALESRLNELDKEIEATEDNVFRAVHRSWDKSKNSKVKITLSKKTTTSLKRYEDKMKERKELQSRVDELDGEQTAGLWGLQFGLVLGWIAGMLTWLFKWRIVRRSRRP